VANLRNWSIFWGGKLLFSILTLLQQLESKGRRAVCVWHTTALQGCVANTACFSKRSWVL